MLAFCIFLKCSHLRFGYVRFCVLKISYLHVISRTQIIISSPTAASNRAFIFNLSIFLTVTNGKNKQTKYHNSYVSSAKVCLADLSLNQRFAFNLFQPLQQQQLQRLSTSTSQQAKIFQILRKASRSVHNVQQTRHCEENKARTTRSFAQNCNTSFPAKKI